VVAGLTEALPDAPPVVTIPLVKVLRTVQAYRDPSQLQLRIDELPRGIRVGFAVKVQVPLGVTPQSEFVLQVFGPSPSTIVQEAFRHSKCIAGSGPQSELVVQVSGPTPLTLIQEAFWHSKWLGDPVLQDEPADKHPSWLGPAPATITQEAFWHSK
jgi:hypothetical protein